MAASNNSLVLAGRLSRKLVHQVPARRAFEEGVDDLDVGDAGELGALLGEAPHIVAQGLIGLLTTPFEVSVVSRAHVCALDVAHEDLDQVGQLWIWSAGKCSSHVRVASAR